MTNSDLSRRAQQIIRLHEELDATKADLSAAYQDAAGEGYTLKALRAAIKIHRMGAETRAKHDAAQMDLEMYLSELEGRREAAE